MQFFFFTISYYYNFCAYVLVRIYMHVYMYLCIYTVCV